MYAKKIQSSKLPSPFISFLNVHVHYYYKLDTISYDSSLEKCRMLFSSYLSPYGLK